MLEVDTLVDREILNRGKKNEHEYALFSSLDGTTDIDIINFEGGLTASYSSNTRVKEFLEATESKYPVRSSTRIEYLMEDEWHYGSPKEIIDSAESIDALLMDYHEKESFDTFWTRYDLENGEIGSQIDITVYYDDVKEPYTNPVEEILSNIPGEFEESGMLDDLRVYTRLTPGLKGNKALPEPRNK